jgi:hypothetical protein
MTARYDNRKYSATMPPGYGLRDLVAFLVKIANSGELDKKGKRRLTGLEHARLCGHGRWLSSAVEELVQILTDGQAPDAQERRLDLLRQALGSGAVIASYQAKNPMVERKELECAARGTREIKARSQEADRILITLATPYWREHPDHKSWTVAGAILVELNRQLEAKGLRPLKRHAVRTRLDKLRPYIT